MFLNTKLLLNTKVLLNNRGLTIFILNRLCFIEGVAIDMHTDDMRAWAAKFNTYLKPRWSYLPLCSHS